MRVLAVGAHPDDLELLYAGTLAKYVEQGHHVSMAVATNGDAGSMTLPKEEIAAVRKAEAEAAAAVIGADFIWMGYPDGFLFSREDTRLAFLNMMRRAHPDVVITHAPADYHPDHRATGGICWDTRIMTTIPNFKTEYPVCERIPEIFYMDTVAGINFQPEHYVDISASIELKRKMLACHKSQGWWMEAQYGMNFEFMECVACFRGLQYGARYAECFQTSPTWPRWCKPSLLP
jgi:LmbE family N-acetylglucosaminyl deacetylase